MGKSFKAAKAIFATAAGATGLYLFFGEALYEGALNKKFTNYKNVRRKVDEDLYQYYDEPSNQVDSDAWFVAMHPVEQKVISSSGDEMLCYVFKQEEYTAKWAVVIHGYSSCPRGMADQAMYFYKKGYNVLMPTMVSFENDKSQYCTMGHKDKDYVLEWLNYIVASDENAEIVILGVSMGSATTLLVTGEELPSNVKCAIADCGFTSFWDICTTQIKEMFHLPVFPFIYAANTVSKLRGNLDFRKDTPIEAVSRSKTPTFFIHGEEDAFVPYWMMDKLFDACTAEKQRMSVPDAHHAESCDIHPEKYYPAIDAFLAKYM